ncbi:phosphatidylethanolamine-binding protein [Lysobacter concretionis Ko07 = DSM 16239]|uniref:Phosphatidylethanolamine-binding protein n=1 Tax=Lysobacter concretionis Ko07 = DSM 16239 TaxID=1122185 RepID=A0A0A0EQD2_9GAMM|nr:MULTISPECIES: YbhB/YbcL family Raf kinase inhibitor-like protein [Lysobacter]KGM51347.1 phosphatidylethanolamine-binding protein [Lysobacter concretionis Ko07 = DSM 16239]QOD91053.1 YbhB/YbcL family Raf kinase inhibitor-like protein [Lysobacter sp. CW239]
MHIRSNSFQRHQPLPVELAAGQPTADGFGFAPNRNPHLAWDDVPAGTKSFALLCVDPDVPTVPEMVGKAGVSIPVDQPRCDFIHWVMVDIPAEVREIAAGACSDGIVPHGKSAPAGPAGSRQGLNDYTGWFADDPTMAGDWYGYDGAFPPPNDLRLHRYFFRVFALDIERLPVPDRFTGAEAMAAMHGHILAEAATYATYTLNPDV